MPTRRAAGTAAAAVDDDGAAPAGNPASTIGDLNANIGDNPARHQRGDVHGHAGRQRRRRRRRRQRLLVCGDSTAPPGTVGIETVTYSWNGGTNTLTASRARAARLFTVQVTDPATGAYTVTLLDNVLHAGGPNDENDRSTAA